MNDELKAAAERRRIGYADSQTEYILSPKEYRDLELLADWAAAELRKDETPVDQPLKCSIEQGQLVIRIGIDTLAHAAAHCERFYDYEQHDGPPYLKIMDNEQFARDVIRQLESEEENGASIISTALDDAIVEAHGDGSEAIDYSDE